VHLVDLRKENFKRHGMYKFKISIMNNVLLISGNSSVPEVQNIATSTVLNYIGIIFEGYIKNLNKINNFSIFP
jgi:hypothetical protein